MTTRVRPQQHFEARLARLVEPAMTLAIEEYDDDAAVHRLAWLAKTTMPPWIRPATSA